LTGCATLRALPVDANHANPGPPSKNDRLGDEQQLNGWKEIAAFFGKGVRTVQRWEREMGLPVRRLPGPRGEIVFALPSELRDWRQKLEQETRNGEDQKLDNGSPPSPAASAGDVALAHSPSTPLLRFRDGRYLLAALILVALVAVASTAGLLIDRNNGPLPRRTELGPATSEVRGNTLVALDERGAPLWSHRFDTPLEPAYPSPSSGNFLKIVVPGCRSFGWPASKRSART